MASFDAVTFDHWNTLVYEEGGALRERRIDSWVEILEDEQDPATLRASVARAFDKAWDAYVARWTEGAHFSGSGAAEVAVDELGFPVSDTTKVLLGEAFVSAGDGLDFHLTDGIEDCLRTLKHAGLRLGIICDVGFTPSPILRAHLERRGLLGYFDGWSFSDEVNAYKPDPIIFRHALDTLGRPAPERVAHVGDLRRTDIAGALSMGMTALRYTGVFDDPAEHGPEATHVLADYAELPGLLGL